MDSFELLLVVQAAAAWFMTGLIWVIQIVHYPLMNRVGEDNWLGYERSHMARITWIVAPAMLIEAGTCGLCLAMVLAGTHSADGPATAHGLHITLAMLLAIAWVSTWLLQVPAHTSLARGFTDPAHRKLVTSNWLRTAAWTARAVLLSAMTYSMIR